jgi:P27 family predicted phage terminase small subunit
MPKWFTTLEKEKWTELCQLLEGNRVMSKDTIEIMIAYCTAYRHWREAREQVEKTGLAIVGVDKQGNTTITKNAYVTEMNKFRDQINKLLPEFGLTPASRQKLVVAKPEQEESAFSALLERMQGIN